MKIWLDGTIQDPEHARIPVLDHGLLYGDGIFEGIRIARGRVFRLDTYLRRLSNSAKAIALELPVDLQELRKIVLDTARAHGEPEAYVRLIVTRGTGALGIDASSCERPRIICIVGSISVYSEEKRARGLDLVTSALRRPRSDMLDPRVKSLNYLNNVLARLDARRAGADDALLLNDQGAVVEASVANLFAYRDGTLTTPPTSDGALDGINRATVLDLAREAGLATCERTLTRYDLFAADEVFLTGSGAGLIRVRSIDGRTLPSASPVLAMLTKAFAEAVHALGTPF